MPYSPITTATPVTPGYTPISTGNNSVSSGAPASLGYNPIGTSKTVQPASQFQSMIPTAPSKSMNPALLGINTQTATKTSTAPTSNDSGLLGAVGNIANNPLSFVNNLTDRPAEGSPQSKTTGGNFISSLVETILPGVKAVRDNPELAATVTKNDLLQGAKDATVNQFVKPIASYPLSFYGAASQYITKPLGLGNAPGVNDTGEFHGNVPGLGDFTNIQSRIAADKAGQPAATTFQTGVDAAMYTGEEFLNGLFTASLVSQVVNPRVSAVTGQENARVPAGMNIPENVGPKSFRLYNPNVLQSPIAPDVFQKIVDDNGIPYKTSYNPNLPTYFEYTGETKGVVSGRFVQVKPSYLDQFLSLFKGDISKVPNTELIPVAETTVTHARLNAAATIPNKQGGFIKNPLATQENIGPEKALTAEAKKYKTPDEFVKAQFNKKPEYGMSHRPSWEGMPPASNLLEGEALPRDVYTNPDFSISTGRIRSGDKAATESWTALQKIRNKPDAEITVYRAGRADKLNTGDWVTFSKDYAKQSLEGDVEKVYSFKVKAKDVIFAGDDINEFGYYPKSQLIDIWNKAQTNQVGKATEMVPTYQGETDLTTNILKKLEGKPSVSKQFISDLTNSPELKQAERDTIRTVLESYPADKPIPVADFAAKVKAELLPLTRTNAPASNNMADIAETGDDSSRYESITLPPELRGPVANYSEHIYNSPIKTSAGSIHWGDGKNAQNYFGHTRVEDLPNSAVTKSLDNGDKVSVNDLQASGGTTRRIIEVQSDLYQKGNLENEITKPVFRPISGNDKELAQIDRFGNTVVRNKGETQKLYEARQKEVAKLAQYSNPTAHFRMVREEIKQAAIDGKTKLQFPTGETAMKIEGLGQNPRQWTHADTGGQVVYNTLEVGQTLQQGNRNMGRDEWVVTDVLGDGKFKAVSESTLNSAEKSIKAAGTDEARIKQINETVKAYAETFDISGKVDTSNPIYKFYEKDLGRYLTNKYGAKVITDAQGVKWYEINVPKEAAKEPVVAFKNRSRNLSFTNGPKATTAQIAELLKGVVGEDKINLLFSKEIFDKNGNPIAGAYKGTRDELINSKIKPLIELVEKNNKVFVRHAFHESFHYLMDRIYTPEFKGQLIKETLAKMTPFDHEVYPKDIYETPEARAEEYLADEFGKSESYKAGYKSPLQSIIDKIKDFLQKVIDAVKKVYQDLTGPEAQKGAVQNPFESGESKAQKTIDAFEKSSNQKNIGMLDGKEVEIGSYGENAITRKIAGGQKDRLPVSEIPVTLKHVQTSYKAGIDPFRKDNLVSVAKMPNGETRAIVTRVNSAGKEEVINFFKIGRDPQVFVDNLKSFGTPDGNRTHISLVRTETSGPSDGSTSNLANPEENVKQPLATENYTGETYHPSPLERKLENLYMERDMHTEALDYLKSKVAPTMKYISSATGRLPEVTGKPTIKSLSGSGKDIPNSEFGLHGDDIAKSAGFANAEELQQAIDDYKVQIERTKEYNARIGDLKERIKIQKAENNDTAQLSKFLERAARKTDKQVSAMQKALEHPETDKEIQARKLAAAERQEIILRKAYSKTSALERETPAWLLQATERSWLSEDEFHKMGMDDPLSVVNQMMNIDLQTPLKNKIGIHDLFRTPDRVLNKIGLGDIGRDLRRADNNYHAELPSHMDLISAWRKEVPTKEGNLRMFLWLDGQYNIAMHAAEGASYNSTLINKLGPLTTQEMTTAKEIRAYLRTWADRLGLPADQIISQYITHVFGLSGTEKEFDEEMAKIIREKVPGSVYDPFLTKRLGRKGYKQDTWASLEAYAKRAVRKVHMDPVLEHLKIASAKLEDTQLAYVKRYADRINMRPSEFDNWVDNSIKMVVGYKFGARPTAFLTSTMRKWTSRYLIGANVSTMIKNLSQGVNTFAALGPKYTTIGYTKLITMAGKEGQEELQASGLFGQNIVQDKTVSAVHKTMQKLDNGLYAMMQVAEHINRGAAYWGAKSKAIDEGKTEFQAKEYAAKIGRDTQFAYGPIDTPVVLSGDIMKTFTQFMSYPVKQAEFVAEMLQHKQWAQIIRYIIGAIVIAETLGKIFNMKARDFIPGSQFVPAPGYFGNSKFGNPPALALPGVIIQALMALPSSVDPTKGPKGGKSPLQKTGESIWNNIPFPAGLEIKKIMKGGPLEFITTMKATSKKSTKSKALMF